MDMLDGIPDWLKTTIPGIIILGACGSLLAIALIHFVKLLFRFFKYIFKKILPRQAKRIAYVISKIVGKVRYSYGRRLGSFSVPDPTFGAIFYFSYHLACSFCLLILSASMAIIVIILVLGLKNSAILTRTTFLLTAGSFLLGFWSLRHFLFIFLPYHNYIDIVVFNLKTSKHKENPGTLSKDKDVGGSTK
jgi:hypothetical protein